MFWCFSAETAIRSDGRTAYFLFISFDGLRQEFFVLHLVHLVHHQHQRLVHFPKTLEDLLLGGAEIRSRLHDPEDHVRVGNSLLRHVHHKPSQLVLRPGETRCILENDLSSLVGIDRADLAPGRLGLLRSDGDLLSDQMVHQRGLSHVGAPDQRRKSGFHSFFPLSSVRSVFLSPRHFQRGS